MKRIYRNFNWNLKDKHGVKTLNIFYDVDSGMMFCLLDAPDKKGCRVTSLEDQNKV
jgi:hypothetical protein